MLATGGRAKILVPMSTRFRNLECRTSLLALAIATAGASVHFAIEIAMAPSASERSRDVTCPGHGTATDELEPDGAVSEPSYLEAVELRCRAAKARRCEVARAIDAGRAVETASTLFGEEHPDHVFLRYAPAYRRVVWTVTDTRSGMTADLDAFDGAVIEFTADGVTTN